MKHKFTKQLPCQFERPTDRWNPDADGADVERMGKTRCEKGWMDVNKGTRGSTSAAWNR